MKEQSVIAREGREDGGSMQAMIPIFEFREDVMIGFYDGRWMEIMTDLDM
jgi:hypothetical protein